MAYRGFLKLRRRRLRVNFYRHRVFVILARRLHLGFNQALIHLIAVRGELGSDVRRRKRVLPHEKRIHLTHCPGLRGRGQSFGDLIEIPVEIFLVLIRQTSALLIRCQRRFALPLQISVLKLKRFLLHLNVDVIRPGIIRLILVLQRRFRHTLSRRGNQGVCLGDKSAVIPILGGRGTSANHRALFQIVSWNYSHTALLTSRLGRTRYSPPENRNLIA